ncbi:MAG: hypothetical protein ACYCZ7_02165 [Minisyncoccota bacterium]
MDMRELLGRIARAKEDLGLALGNTGLCSWPIRTGSDNLLYGVTLSWPEQKAGKVEEETRIARETTERIAKKYGLQAYLKQPTLAAGGVLVLYCGFKSPSPAKTEGEVCSAQIR